MCRKRCSCRRRGGTLGWHKLPVALNRMSINPSLKAASVEVELTDYRGLDTASPQTYTYTVVRDGSVNRSEKEMVIGPYAGRRLVTVLGELAVGIVRSRAVADDSCGYHVHVNAADSGAVLLPNVCRVWELFLPTVKGLFPKRFPNECAQELGGMRDYRKLYKSVLESRSNREVRANVWDWLYGPYGWRFDARDRSRNFNDPHGPLRFDRRNNIRYTDLNLHSWYYRGTIEFRIAPMLTQPPHIVGWPLTCLALVDIAEKTPLRKLVGMTPADLEKLLPAAAIKYLGWGRNTLVGGGK